MEDDSQAKFERKVIPERRLAGRLSISDSQIESRSARQGMRERIRDEIARYAERNGLDLAADIKIVWRCEAGAPAFERPEFTYEGLDPEEAEERAERDEQVWLSTIRQSVAQGHREVVIDLNPEPPAWVRP